MTAATLTEDQRWLLYVAARHVMPIALIDPDYGITSIKQSHAGGCWPPGRGCGHPVRTAKDWAEHVNQALGGAQ
ncbi:hypothetical protein [Mycobacterium sp. 48b]|uniref:hypothetical protein n=1 Tax=Mycobacterium sp. 48b TaxID=3400426 RepID=UPI003AAB3FEC